MAKRVPIPINDRALPFKLSSMTVGAQAAYQQMVSGYGLTRGRQIYLQKAEESGTGNTIRQKVNSTYHLGAKKGDNGKFS